MAVTPLRLFLRFLRFGLLAFGGPVAQLSMLREELVDREGWTTRERFHRALALYQLLPGPEPSEMCVWFGMNRLGRTGGDGARCGCGRDGEGAILRAPMTRSLAKGMGRVAAAMLAGWAGLCAAPAAADGGTVPTGFRVGGYVESYYQWNFNQPADGLTRLRGFDNRHGSLALSNASVDVGWNGERASGRLALQWGTTPASYYLAEPSSAGSAGVAGAGPVLWQVLQEAWGAYRLDVAGGLLLSAGLFTSPVGPEVVPVRDNWHWSRSNLFFGLPYYHAGVTAAASVGSAWTVTAGIFNGWNAVLDGNPEKSVMVRASSDPARAWSGALLYFGGVERPAGAAEGRAWRHLVDGYAQWRASGRWTWLAHVDGGWEPNHFGTSGWLAAELGTRYQLAGPWAVAGRVDGFREWVAGSKAGRATPIFWPVDWVAAATATLEWRAEAGLLVRVEYRHDEAAAPVYGTRSVGLVLPRQDTVTLGMVAGF